MDVKRLMKNLQLVAAIQKGDLSEVGNLIDSDVDINFINLYKNNETLLHEAVMSGNPEIVEMLLIRKANTDALNGANKKPIQLCSVLDDPKKEIIEALFAKYSKQSDKKKEIVQDVSVVSRCQEELFKTTVTFQGTSMPLMKLIDEAPIDLIDAVTLEKLISDENTIISKHNYCDNDDGLSDIYIERALFDKNNVSKSITEIDDSVVIVAADLGMGKSTLLSRLELVTKKENPAIWVVKINVPEYLDQIHQWTESNIAIDKSIALNLLMQATLYKNDNNSDTLESYIFRWYCKNNKIFLLIDGIDKVSTDYIDVVLRLLDIYKHQFTQKLWLTTRKGAIQEKLEDKLKVSAYSLKPFTREEFKLFLWNKWKNMLDKIPVQQSLFDSYVEQLLLHLSTSTDNGESELVYVPFQTKMVAHILQNSFLEYCKLPGRKTSFDRLSIIYLYEKYVDVKINEMLMEGKTKIDLTNPFNRQNIQKHIQTLTQKHQKAAFFALANRKPIDCFLTDIDIKTVTIFLQEIQGSIPKTYPFISNVVDDLPIFVNQSYADFFAAQYIWEKFCYVQNSEFKILVDSVLIKIVIRRDLVQVARFLYEFSKININSCTNIAFKSIHLLEGILNTITKVLLEFEKTTYSFILGIVENALASDNQCHIEFQRSKILPHKNLNILFLKASESGCISIIRLLNENKEDLINVTFDQLIGWTALHFAAYSGHEVIVQYLIENKTNINAVTMDNGKNALLMAVKKGHCEIVKLLLKSGANLNTCTADIGLTPLHMAVEKGHCEIVQLLLENGANVHTCTADIGLTPLHLASKHGHVKIVHLLLKKGAVVNARTRDIGLTPFYMAIEIGHCEIVQLLLKNGANVHTCTIDIGLTPLHSASKHGHLKIVDLLLKKGADVNACTRDIGLTPLHMAVENGHCEIVKLLLKSGADLNTCTPDIGLTPLHLASKHGHVKIVHLLLNKGAVVNACTRDIGLTPLHMAVENGHCEIVQLLLEYGANIHTYTKDIGLTPLHSASEHGHVKIVDLLLQKGANVNARTTDIGLTPLHMAIENGHFEVVQLLFENGANMQHGANIEASTNFVGHTPMHIAVLYGHTDIKIGKIEERWTPLQLAVKNNATEITTILEKAEAELSLIKAGAGCSSAICKLPSEAKPILEKETLLGEHSKVQEPIKAVKRKYVDESTPCLKRPGTINRVLFYKVKFLTMALFRLVHDYQIEKFYLRNNLKEVGVMGDIVLRTQVGGKSQVYCLQTTNSVKTITVDFKDFVNLQDKRGDFKLHKYIDSYLKIRYMFDPINDNVLFKGKHEQIELEISVFTPAKLIFDDEMNYVNTPIASIFHSSCSGKTLQMKCSPTFIQSFVVHSKQWHQNAISEILAKLILLQKYDSTNLKESIEKLKKENALEKFTNNDNTFNSSSLLQLYCNAQIVSISDIKIKEMSYNISKVLDERLLPSHEEHVEIAKDFLSAFKIYSEQATEDELEHIIRRNINEQNYDHEDLIVSKLHNAATQWLTNADQEQLLSKSCHIFEEVHGELQLKEEHLKSMKFIQREKFKFDFTASSLNPKWVYLQHNIKKGKMFHINLFSSSPKLCCMKLIQYLQICCCDFKFFIIDNDTITRILDIFSKTKPQFLIVVYLPKIDGEIIQNIRQRVNNLIFITNHRCHGDWRSIEEDVSILDFETVYQEKLLLENEVKFQGEFISLSLLLKEAPKQLLDAASLETILIKGGILAISKEIKSGHQEDISNNFIERDLLASRKHQRILKPAIQIDERVVIVAADPGVGKTSLLFGLAKVIKKDNPETWIVRINLFDHIKQFHQWVETKTTLGESHAFNFLMDVTCYEKKTSNESFELELFRWYCMQFKLNIQIDGFDEVCPDYTDIVLQLLKILKYNFTSKLWVTSRPVKNQKLLEECLEVCAYLLEPFNEQETKQFLWKYWSIKMGLGQEQAELYDNYFKKLQSICSKSTDYRGHTLLSIPRHTKMVGTMLENNFKTYCNSNGSQDQIPILNFVILYEKFIENFPKLQNTYRQLAIWTLFNHADAMKIVCGTEIKPMNVLLLEVQPLVTESGIIKDVVNGKPIFLFETAEFFAAQFIWDRYASLKVEEFHPFAETISSLLIKNEMVQIAFFLQEIIKNKSCEHVTAKACVILNKLLENLPNSWHDFHKKTFTFLLGVVEYCLETDKNCTKMLEDLLRVKTVKSLYLLLLKASESGHYELVQLVKKFCTHQIEIDWLNGWTALHFAAHRGHKNIAQYLLKSSPDINKVTKDNGQNALHMAAQEGFIEIVSLLLKKGAYVNKPTTVYGESALHFASKNGRVNIVKLLIQYNGNVNIKTSKNGSTPLHFASKYGHMEIVQILLANSADPNVASTDLKFTPLHWAVRNNFPGIVALLLKHGANINSQSLLNDQTPLEIARSYGCTAIENLLLENGANVFSLAQEKLIALGLYNDTVL